MFDLPTDTKKDKYNYTQFRKKLQKDGFMMMQYSIYMRHCPGRENAEAHIKKVKSYLPPNGMVNILRVTDKQFGMMECFVGKKASDPQEANYQLEFF